MDLIGLSVLFGVLGAIIILKYESKIHKKDLEIINLKTEISKKETQFQNRLKCIYNSIEEENGSNDNYKAKYEELMREYLETHRKLNKMIKDVNYHTLGGKQ